MSIRMRLGATVLLVSTELCDVVFVALPAGRWYEDDDEVDENNEY